MKPLIVWYTIYLHNTVAVALWTETSLTNWEAQPAKKASKAKKCKQRAQHQASPMPQTRKCLSSYILYSFVRAASTDVSSKGKGGILRLFAFWVARLSANLSLRRRQGRVGLLQRVLLRKAIDKQLQIPDFPNQLKMFSFTGLDRYSR